MAQRETIKLNIQGLSYPSNGIAEYAGKIVQLKNVLPGQCVRAQITHKKRHKDKLTLQEIEARAAYEVPSFCEHFGECGGCARQTVPYDKQLCLKKQAVANLFKAAALDIKIQTVLASPQIYEYRNKMEYSFGDLEKGGQLNLGMHRKGRFYDVVSIPYCHIVDADYRRISAALETLCRAQHWSKYNRNSGEGLLRNLVIRKGHFTGEILVGIATSSQPGFNAQLFVNTLLSLPLSGQIVGVYHLVNDEVADVVKASAQDHLIYGRDYFYEKLLGLTFKISFHSFFQTNSRGAELLYQRALSTIDSLDDKIVYDLYSGTGTIAQIMAAHAKHVYGIEINAQAVHAARQNARINQIDNCTFMAGDVFAVLDQLSERPDLIVVDPPRAGMTPKTVQKLAAYQVDQILYISCNPKTMAQNLRDFESLGYRASSCQLVDMYPHTPHVECIALIQRVKS